MMPGPPDAHGTPPLLIRRVSPSPPPSRGALSFVDRGTYVRAGGSPRDNTTWHSSYSGPPQARSLQQIAPNAVQMAGQDVPLTSRALPVSNGGSWQRAVSPVMNQHLSNAQGSFVIQQPPLMIERPVSPSPPAPAREQSPEPVAKTRARVQRAAAPPSAPEPALEPAVEKIYVEKPVYIEVPCQRIVPIPNPSR